MSIVTALESALLYFILRPNNFSWSLLRVTVAFVILLILSAIVIFTAVTDMPGYFYVPGGFTIFLTFLLFILFIITVGINTVEYFSKRTHAK